MLIKPCLWLTISNRLVLILDFTLLSDYGFSGSMRALAVIEWPSLWHFNVSFASWDPRTAR